MQLLVAMYNCLLGNHFKTMKMMNKQLLDSS